MCVDNVGENVEIILHMPNYVLHIEGHPLNHFYGWVGGGERFFKVGGGGGEAFFKVGGGGARHF